MAEGCVDSALQSEGASSTDAEAFYRLPWTDLHPLSTLRWSGGDAGTGTRGVLCLGFTQGVGLSLSPSQFSLLSVTEGVSAGPTASG